MILKYVYPHLIGVYVLVSSLFLDGGDDNNNSKYFILNSKILTCSKSQI